MPDFTIITSYQCSQLDTHSTRVKDYTLTFMPEYGWDCSCPGYKYHGSCKHIEEAEKNQCSYQEFLDGPPKEPGVCPRCGGSLTVVRVAV